MLYGKWRPRGFDEVAGQDHIVTTLRNALASGQVAHAYLFCGPRGTGKTTTARILARAVNCLNLQKGEPCNACEPCKAINRGNALDLIELDAASNRGIDDIKELRDKIAFAPSDLTRKVYLLDEVHMLTTPAFNALLKTLEEPPPHAIFILATTESHAVPATIISRCQRYDFRRLPNDALVGRLRHIAAEEGFAIPEQGLLQISIQSRGGARDAITMLEQVVARYGAAPSAEEVLEALGLVHDPRSETLAAAILEGDLGSALDIARSVADDGVNIARFTRETIDILREVLPQVLRDAPREDSPNRALAEAVLRGRKGPAPIVAAISELARADFRLDPGSPIPLEVACAAAILGPVGPVTHAPAPVAGGVATRPPAAGQTRGAANSGPRPDDRTLTTEERFLKDLYERAKLEDQKIAAKLNGSCEVISISDSLVEIGVFYEFHLTALENEGLPVLQRNAEAILGRPVVVKLKLSERQPGQQRAARSGHLVKTAVELGAKPVDKG